MGESFSEHHLDPGGRALLVNAPGALTLRVQLAFEGAGRMAMSPERHQVPHLAEHMIKKGCKALPTEPDFRRAVQTHGAKYGATTYDDFMTYELTSPARNWETPFWALLRAVEAPLFREKDLISERSVVEQELAGYASMVSRILEPLCTRALGTPYPTYEEGLETLDDIAANDLAAYHRATHAGGALRAVITGDFKERVNAELVLNGLNGMDLPKGLGSPRRLDVCNQPTQPVVLDGYEGLTIDYELLKFGLPFSTEEAAVTNRLVEAQLFQHPHTAISLQARNAGLVYSVHGERHRDTVSADMARISTRITPDKVVPFFNLVANVLRRDPTSISQAELDDVKTYAAGRLMCDNDSPEALHDYAWETYVVGEYPLAIEEQAAQYGALSLDAYREAYYQYVRGGVGLLTAVGSAADLQSPEVVEANSQMQDFLANLQ